MIILASKDNTRNMHTLHMILGPESMLALDIEGRIRMDLTEVLSRCGAGAGTGTVEFSLSRSPSEAETVSALDRARIPYMTNPGAAAANTNTNTDTVPGAIPDVARILDYAVPADPRELLP